MITINSTATDEHLEGDVGDDLRRFDEWFKSQGNTHLVRSETAILKTYLYWKMKGGGNVAKAGS